VRRKLVAGGGLDLRSDAGKLAVQGEKKEGRILLGFDRKALNTR